MPNLADGKSTLAAVLDGDPGQQRDALWQYFAQGPEAGEPAGLVLEPLMIAVRDEAVIVRRAFPVSANAASASAPGWINLAFDAAQMRLGSMWSGGLYRGVRTLAWQGFWTGAHLGKDIITSHPAPPSPC